MVASMRGMRSTALNCRDGSCSGEYEEREVLHAQRFEGRVVVIDHVPALVRPTCGEVQFSLKTVERIEKLLESGGEPTRTAPSYEYA